MNIQLETALADMITKATQGVEAGAELLVAEVPEVLSQLLLWYGVYNLLTTVVALGLWVFLVWFTIAFSGNRDGKFSTTHMGDGSDEVGPIIMLTGMVHLTAFLFMITTVNLEWLKIWLAPKIWLIEYGATLAAKVVT